MNKSLFYKVADTWAEIISRDANVFDNGEKDISNMFAAMFAESLYNQTEKPTDEQIEIFKNTMVAEMEELCSRLHFVEIGADYAPDTILSRSLKAAEISVQRIPWKTFVKIDGNKVYLKEGYGGIYEEVS